MDVRIQGLIITWLCLFTIFVLLYFSGLINQLYNVSLMLWIVIAIASVVSSLALGYIFTELYIQKFIKRHYLIDEFLGFRDTTVIKVDNKKWESALRYRAWKF